uniref:Uncharacterized protein n=1 Tax=Myotis myotis TaxID=51298 RepID=A0A7J7XH07_MYOMY|nr:hypothetical protein mMyoMyo1_011587 [Myotis myotis]
MSMLPSRTLSAQGRGGLAGRLSVGAGTAVSTGRVSCEPTRARGWAAQDGEVPHRWGEVAGPGPGRTAQDRGPWHWRERGEGEKPGESLLREKPRSEPLSRCRRPTGDRHPGPDSWVSSVNLHPPPSGTLRIFAPTSQMGSTSLLLGPHPQPGPPPGNELIPPPPTFPQVGTPSTSGRGCPKTPSGSRAEHSEGRTETDL